MKIKAKLRQNNQPAKRGAVQLNFRMLSCLSLWLDQRDGNNFTRPA